MQGLFFVSNRKERVPSQEVGGKVISILKKEFKYFPIYPEKFNLDKNTSTYNLLKNKEIKNYIKKKKGLKANLLVFKNSKSIQDLCFKEGYKLLNTDYKITNYLENKITQAEFIFKNKIPAPFTVWGKFEDIDFYKVANKINLPFVLQFGRGHSGKGSYIINNEEKYKKLREKFPLREVRISKLIKGETGTINLCLDGNQLILGLPMLQITGIPELTDNKLSTVGNDWYFLRKLFEERKIEKKFLSFIKKISSSIFKIGYQGIFGLDFIIVEENREPFKLIEINARFPATLAKEISFNKEKTKNNLLASHIEAFLINKKKFLKDLKINSQIKFYNKSRLIKRDNKGKEIKEIDFSRSIYEGNGKVNKKALENFN